MVQWMNHRYLLHLSVKSMPKLYLKEVSKASQYYACLHIRQV